MISMNLREAYDCAQTAAPGLDEDAFLEQTRILLQRGRLQATAARAVIRHDEETFELKIELRAPRELDARETIPADAWNDLSLSFSDSGSAQGWGHDHALPGSPTFPADGCFEGLELYVGVVLLAESFTGLWTVATPDAPPRWTDDELMGWLREMENDLGHRPPTRTWQKNADLMAGRGVTKQRFEAVWHALYPDPEKGRRRDKMPQECPEKENAGRRAP
jgi:hypothetical protein